MSIPLLITTSAHHYHCSLVWLRLVVAHGRMSLSCCELLYWLLPLPKFIKLRAMLVPVVIFVDALIVATLEPVTPSQSPCQCVHFVVTWHNSHTHTDVHWCSTLCSPSNLGNPTLRERSECAWRGSNDRLDVVIQTITGSAVDVAHFAIAFALATSAERFDLVLFASVKQFALVFLWNVLLETFGIV